MCGTGYIENMPATMTMEFPADVLESARMSVPDLKLELAISLFSLGFPGCGAPDCGLGRLSAHRAGEDWQAGSAQGDLWFTDGA